MSAQFPAVRPSPPPNQGSADCIIHRLPTCCSQHLVVSWDGFAPILSGFDAPKFRVVVTICSKIDLRTIDNVLLLPQTTLCMTTHQT